MSEIVAALVEYAGPLDDPRIGWTGSDPMHNDMFKCERCGAENYDSSKILHTDGCSAARLLSVLSRPRPNTTSTTENE